MNLFSLLGSIPLSFSLIPGSGPGLIKPVPTSALGFTTDNPDAPNTDEYESTQGSNTESEKSMAHTLFLTEMYSHGVTSPI